MIMRLEMVEKGLVQKLKLVSKEQRRSAVKVACELAFQACPVEVPIVVESLRQPKSAVVTSRPVLWLPGLMRFW